MGGRTGVSLKRLVLKKKKNNTDFDLKYNTKPQIVMSFEIEEAIENFDTPKI